MADLGDFEEYSKISKVKGRWKGRGECGAGFKGHPELRVIRGREKIL